MNKNFIIPNDYFDDQEFLITEIEEAQILAVLGPNPSADQFLKYSLCGYITHLINVKGLSLSDAEKITGVNPSDLSRIKNHHLDRFTIDRLMKISLMLDSPKGLGHFFKSIGAQIEKMPAA